MKVIISGAGIAGLTTALALDRAGWEVRVLEKAPHLRAGGYMLDFFGPGFDAAEDLGVIEALRAKARGVGKVDFVDGEGRIGSSMDYRQIGQATGGRLFPILRGDIERVLHGALPERVEINYGASIAALTNRDDGVAVTLEDGRDMVADLLVGADGIHSRVRELAFGPERDFIRPLGFHTAAYFCESAAVARALGGDFRMMTVKDRMMGLYEVEKDQIMAFFAMRAEGGERPDDPRQRLQAAFGDLGWVVPEVLVGAPGPEDIYYDVVAQIEMESWHQGRTVLVGDAGYAVSLMAGQGASLAMAGGRALGQVLAGAEDIGVALDRFEAELRPLIAEKQQAGRRMANWFVPASSAHVMLRDLAVNVMNWPIFNGVIGRFFSVSSKGFSLG